MATKKHTAKPATSTEILETLQLTDEDKAFVQAAKARVKLTKPQWAELRRLYHEGPQNTYGSARAHVQNNLVALGLAFYNVEGVVELVPLSDLCTITEAGKEQARLAKL